MGALRMSMKERRRLELLSRVGEGILTLRKAAGLAKLSYRQMKRIPSDHWNGVPARYRASLWCWV